MRKACGTPLSLQHRQAGMAAEFPFSGGGGIAARPGVQYSKALQHRLIDRYKAKRFCHRSSTFGFAKLHLSPRPPFHRCTRA